MLTTSRRHFVRQTERQDLAWPGPAPWLYPLPHHVPRRPGRLPAPSLHPCLPPIPVAASCTHHFNVVEAGHGQRLQQLATNPARPHCQHPGISHLHDASGPDQLTWRLQYLSIAGARRHGSLPSELSPHHRRPLRHLACCHNIRSRRCKGKIAILMRLTLSRSSREVAACGHGRDGLGSIRGSDQPSLRANRSYRKCQLWQKESGAFFAQTSFSFGSRGYCALGLGCFAAPLLPSA
jgi:hypothetical protein